MKIKFLIILASSFLIAQNAIPKNSEDIDEVREFLITYHELYRKSKISKEIEKRVAEYSENSNGRIPNKLKIDFDREQNALLLEAKKITNLSDELFQKYKKPMRLHIP